MSEDLDRLAQAYGIEPAYISEKGEQCVTSDDTKRALLASLSIDAATKESIETALKSAPQITPNEIPNTSSHRCFMPEWLANGRAWGITCQLYGLRSERNWGIGDFEDLARLSELAARAGADFIGVNPLHALFFADARRYSPYAPSSRLLLNPYYIAVDRLAPQPRKSDAARANAARATELVDYEQVARLKRDALERSYVHFRRASGRTGARGTGAFQTFCAERGSVLSRFALWEALSESLCARGYYSGWHTWPVRYQSHDSHAVRRFERENEDRINFHKWLQWVAERQLRDAQERARAAGMRIGLYLDLAVGVAPDGADTWSQPGTVVRDARIGSPPDAFNDQGQDWGLAPFSPAGLARRHFAPFDIVLQELMRNAGAVRIDHAMALVRLFWIPQNAGAKEGAYMRYPAAEMFAHLAENSQDRATIVIGEDLGTVPPGFREAMSAAAILGYRVLYFEREQDRAFRRPETYARNALSCLSTHDLPTFKGWWGGTDIDWRERIGSLSSENAEEMRKTRGHDRSLLVAAVREAGLLPPSLKDALNGTSTYPLEVPGELIVAAHALLARTPSHLVAVQLEDLTGTEEQANLPGTVDEHPNWRRKLPIDLKDISRTALFQDITRAVSLERPRT